jgi:hypothetical protein
MRRALTLALLLAACGGTATITTASNQSAVTTATTALTTTTRPTTTTAPTTTTLSQADLDQLEYEGDVELIKDLWRDHSDSWSIGIEAGYAHAADNDYPALECTVDAMRTHYDYLEGTSQEMVVHPETIERDDDWTSPALGSVPDGRIYIYQITHAFEQPGVAPESRLIEVHATLLGDRAFFFIDCR